MKIVCVCRGYPTHRPGGMLFVCQDRAEALVRKGLEVHVLTTGLRPNQMLVQEVNGVVVHHLACTPTEYTNAFAEGCARLCNELHPDIIHLDSVDFSRPWWRKRPGNPACIAVTMHGFETGAFLTHWNMYRCGCSKQAPEKFPAKQIKEHSDLMEKTFDRVIAISWHEHWMLTDIYGLMDVSLIYNPIHRDFFARPIAPLPEERKFLCAAISGHTERGFDIAEKAAKLAGIPLEKLSNISRSQMPARLDACTGVVLPTFYSQGFDLTVAEALARGRPVIVTRTGSYWREYQAGLRGIMPVRMADVGAFATAMQYDSLLPGEQIALDAERFHPDRHAEHWLGVMTS